METVLRHILPLPVHDPKSAHIVVAPLHMLEHITIPESPVVRQHAVQPSHPEVSIVGPGTGAGVGPGTGAGVGPGTGAGVGPGTGAGVGPGTGAGVGPGATVGFIGFPG
jgi:hypothetical protein